MIEDKVTKKIAKQAEDEKAVLDAIANMPEKDRAIGKRLDTIIRASAPDLLPRTWYGMPAYSNGNKIICFFRSRQKFGERFMTLGFNDTAKLDEGSMWPIYYALTELTASDEAKIAVLVKKAVS
jgi:hypothetical protein